MLLSMSKDKNELWLVFYIKVEQKTTNEQKKPKKKQKTNSKHTQNSQYMNPKYDQLN